MRHLGAAAAATAEQAPQPRRTGRGTVTHGRGLVQHRGRHRQRAPLVDGARAPHCRTAAAMHAGPRARSLARALYCMMQQLVIHTLLYCLLHLVAHPTAGHCTGARVGAACRTGNDPSGRPAPAHVQPHPGTGTGAGVPPVIPAGTCSRSSSSSSSSPQQWRCQ
jgi:hypothetical protein